MKVALIGFGRMGQEIAKQPDAEITAVIDNNHPDATCPTITAAELNKADVAIDFTHPDCAISNLKKVADSNTNLVMGTTGWYNDMDTAREIVENSNIGFIWASNFSIGIHMFWDIIKKAAQNFSKLSDYDVFGHEFHHNQKADSPSGTAKSTAEILLEYTPGKKKISYETQHAKIEPESLHFSSTRGGSIPGTHSVYFDSSADTIEITHSARSREGFARGALKAAEWIKNKKGFYSIDDLLADIL